MALKVIDVSYAQGRMDWEAVAPHIGGAIIQLGYGSDYASQDDAQWARNVSECKRLGIPFGAYLYSYARTDDMARSEVAHALRLLPPPSELALPVYLDVEESGNAWFFRRAIEIWVSGLREAGYTAGWYSGRALANQYGLAGAPGETWVAEYGASRCAFSGRLDAWQYTSQEWIGGVGPLDASWFYRDYGSGAGPSAPAPSQKAEVGEIRYRVRTEANGWLAEMVGLSDTGGSGDDYAGDGSPILYLAMDFPGWYQVRTEGQGWLPKVSRYDVGDLEDGCAGDGTPITGVRCYYETQDPDATGWKVIEYAVANIGGGFLAPMRDLSDTGGSGDDFAGNGGRISAIRARVADA